MKEYKKEDLIARTVIDHFFSLGKSPLSSGSTCSSTSLEYTVIAAFVAESTSRSKISSVDEGTDSNNYHILSFASGTKCLGAKEVAEAVPGTVLKDSHAEVLARRAFNRFLLNFIVQREERSNASFPGIQEDVLYDLLLPVESEGCYSVKGKSITSTNASRYRWNPEWKLHLYISDSPCGDASIYEKKEDSWKQQPQSLSPGQLSTADVCPDVNFTGAKLIGIVKESHAQQVGCMRLKSGRSDIPDKCRTNSYSCSDKIAKWIVIGVQSALVSTLIAPIYLNSIIISLNPMSTEKSQLDALNRAILLRTEQPRISAKLGSSSVCELLISTCIYNYSKSVIDFKVQEESSRTEYKSFSNGDMPRKKQRRTDDSNDDIDHKNSDRDNFSIENDIGKEKKKRKLMKPRPAGCSLNWILNERGENNDSRIELTQAQNGLKMGITTKTIEEMKKAMQDSSISSSSSSSSSALSQPSSSSSSSSSSAAAAAVAAVSLTLPRNLAKIVSRLSQVLIASLYDRVVTIIHSKAGIKADQDQNVEDDAKSTLDLKTTIMQKYSKWKESATIHNNLKNVFLSSESFKEWR